MQYRDITKLWREKRFLKQNGKCAICRRAIRLDVTSSSQNRAVANHCHSTGKTRGLLCNRCNSGVGFFCDSILLLQAAINYLNEYDSGKGVIRYPREVEKSIAADLGISLDEAQRLIDFVDKLSGESDGTK